MNIKTKKDLINLAKTKGYRPEILEKVFLLLELAEYLMSSKILSDNLVLKGGTAINLFCNESLPRLSVDLDFNYIGSNNKDKMLSDKVIITQTIIANAARLNMSLHRNPGSHAGGKMVFIYSSLMGAKGRIEVDINYMHRTPLFGIKNARPISWLQQINMPVLDIHELAAGKLSALFGREVSRDLYDSARLLTDWNLEISKLRLAFVVYLAMTNNRWQAIKISNIKYDIKDIKERLIPVLHKNIITDFHKEKIKILAEQLIDECKAGLEKLLPFNTNEEEFLDLVQTQGLIRPELISDDIDLCAKIKTHPLLLWRIL